jgi:DNA-binding HxlR family transcriptional regulator
LEPLPEEVKRFMDANIESVDQLEVLRLLAGEPGREWNLDSLAGIIQIQPQALTLHLAALESRGLITASHGPTASYRYGPRTPELENLVGRLLQFYNERPVTMIKMIYARANAALKNFADAFRVRKED